MKIYLASSWRNERQQFILHALRHAGHEVYDFKNPKPGDKGFGWSAVDPDWKNWTPEAFREALNHPVSQAGFANDWEAMQWADAGVLLLPCGRSAHLESGYFVGADKPLFILQESESEPELMYLMASKLCANLFELLDAIEAHSLARAAT